MAPNELWGYFTEIYKILIQPILFEAGRNEISSI